MFKTMSEVRYMSRQRCERHKIRIQGDHNEKSRLSESNKRPTPEFGVKEFKYGDKFFRET